MLVRKPPMGWNSWNTFGENINADLIKETADAFVANGLDKAGYEYLVIDDCWSERERDKETEKIVPDKIKFPNGMKDVSDYVHSKGIKFGMYSCAGVRTCADYPGSFDHEFLDAETFAEYGADFLKYDFCYKPLSSDGPLLYHRMGTALEHCGREILFSACNWGSDNVHRWIRSTGASMYRSTGDINDSFGSFKDILLSQEKLFGFSAPGCFNDIDMLTVGMYGKGNVGNVGCNDTDYKTQFSLWCLFGVPLMLGCDLRNMNEQTLKLITNPDLIAINQDEECRQPFRIFNSDERYVFARRLSGGEFAFGFFNLGERRSNCVMYPFEVGVTANSGYEFTLRDCFTGEVHTGVKNNFAVYLDPHDCAVFRGKLVRSK
ncbi:MAG: glycoside hydrolase family 27 protein [Clostridia bacterium]|nr:glycoside hydrolase family 27 protein [Clostridia bacterium]